MKQINKHTLKCVLMPTTGNTCVATPRGLIAVIENNYQKDGSIIVPEVLRPYMGGKEVIR